MDLTLILLVVLLVVVFVVFVLALRGGGRRENAPVAGPAAEQQAAVRPAIAAPHGQAAAGVATGATGALVAPVAQITTTTTTTREAPMALPAAAAPIQTMSAAEETPLRAEAPVARQSSVPGDTPAREAARADDRVVVRGVPVVERGRPVVETDRAPAAMSEAAEAAAAGAASVASNEGTVHYAAGAPPAPLATTGMPRVEPAGPEVATTRVTTAAAPVAPSPAPVDGASSGAAPAMELVVQPPTRTGTVMLSVAPQRLPFRLAELLGEQRGLEEAITIAHRRIDDVELGPDPGAAENRVRLAVLRQDLTQKQERLREILFLQDGYRWVQQHLAPDHASSEG